MNLISLLSSIAMAVGLAAALPQILRMIRTRSSGGQSVLGWGMGLITNLSMAYVNLFGFGAEALMASNLLSAGLCVAAMALIVRLDGASGSGLVDAEGGAAPTTVRLDVPPAAHQSHLFDMPTTEFVALREAVYTASELRDRRAVSDPELAYAA